MSFKEMPKIFLIFATLSPTSSALISNATFILVTRFVNSLTSFEPSPICPPAAAIAANSLAVTGKV